MKEKKDAFELYALKLKKEESVMKDYIKKRMMENNKLRSILEEDARQTKWFYEEMKVKKTITPNMIYMNNQLSEEEKLRINNEIRKNENEILMIKNEYLKIKNKREKLLEKSSIKKKEKVMEREKREERVLLEERLTKGNPNL